jgi:hypothetical protein
VEAPQTHHTTDRVPPSPEDELSTFVNGEDKKRGPTTIWGAFTSQPACAAPSSRRRPQSCERHRLVVVFPSETPRGS